MLYMYYKCVTLYYMSFHANNGSSELPSPTASVNIPVGTDLACAYHCNSILLLPWTDPLTDLRGYDPRSDYTETFWLGTLGPTVTWLIRFTAYLFDRYPQGIVVDPNEICLRIGIGRGTGPNSALMKAIRRCIRFELARLPLLVAPPPSHPNDPMNSHSNSHAPANAPPPHTPGRSPEYTGKHSSTRILTLEVRRKLPLLPTRYLDKLPDQVRQLHERYIQDLITV